MVWWLVRKTDCRSEQDEAAGGDVADSAKDEASDRRLGPVTAAVVNHPQTEGRQHCHDSHCRGEQSGDSRDAGSPQQRGCRLRSERANGEDLATAFALRFTTSRLSAAVGALAALTVRGGHM